MEKIRGGDKGGEGGQPSASTHSGGGRGCGRRRKEGARDAGSEGDGGRPQEGPPEEER